MGGEPDEHSIEAKDRGGYKKKAWVETPNITGRSWKTLRNWLLQARKRALTRGSSVVLWIGERGPLTHQCTKLRGGLQSP